MSSFKLRSNDDLYQYLVGLSKELESKGKADIAREMNVISRFSLGSPSEFLDESQRLLVSLKSRCSDVLTEKEMNDLAIVIEQIEEAFRRIGGA